MLANIQSSNPKWAKRGSPLPRSVMSSTPMASILSASISMGAASLSPSSPFSSCFFAAAAFRFAGSWKVCWSLRHSWRDFCQADHCSLNHSPGCRSSTRPVSFLCMTKSFKSLAHSGSSCQAKVTSSKPSAFVGREKLAKDLFSSFSAMSETSDFRWTSAFSSSVSSMASGAGSSASSFFSSSPSAPSALPSSFSASSFPSSAPSFASVFARFASRIFLAISSDLRLRSSAAALIFRSASALLFFSSSMSP
mmetsp:Transcript_47930/g.139715  ORF Transcript_47930/g.139715 Transcript_47930/m.139715 type:complete len:251 (-) Transcript_47930:1294-2046(-)